MEEKKVAYSSTSRSRSVPDDEYQKLALQNRSAAALEYSRLKSEAQKKTSIGADGNVNAAISDEKNISAEDYNAIAVSNFKSSRASYLASLNNFRRATEIMRVPTALMQVGISDEKNITQDTFLAEGQKNFREAKVFYRTQIEKTRTATHLAGEPFRGKLEEGLDPEEYKRLAQENFRVAKLQYQDMLARND